MTYNPKIHQRKSLRLRTKNYRSGSYFITICAVNREWLFGEIKNEVMQLNDLGKIVVEEWFNTEKIRTNVKLDTYVVMPNHFHAVIHICKNNMAPILDFGVRGIEHMMDEHHPDAGCSEHHCRGMARHAPTDAITQESSDISVDLIRVLATSKLRPQRSSATGRGSFLHHDRTQRQRKCGFIRLGMECWFSHHKKNQGSPLFLGFFIFLGHPTGKLIIK